MNTTELCAVLGRTRNTIDDVVATLDAVGAALPPTDGAACFNLLYLVTTQHVRGALQGARFEDPAFMDRLDVVFAGLYLDALRRALTGETGVPRAWEALFERRAAGCMPLRFALAGMNAHINYDLARAVVMTTIELGGGVASGSPRHRDFEKINDVLCETEAVVKERFSPARCACSTARAVRSTIGPRCGVFVRRARARGRRPSCAGTCGAHPSRRPSTSPWIARRG